MPERDTGKGGGKYDDMTKDDLEKKARDMGISGHASMKKEELVRALESHDRGGSRGGHEGGSRGKS